MPLEVRKVSDVGVSHPIVARLAAQTTDMTQWIRNKEVRDAVNKLYINNLRERLLRCSAIREGYVGALVKCHRETPKPEPGQQLSQIPHVVGLTGFAETFLYEAKNYLRDLLSIFAVVYQCNLKEASAFTDLKGSGDGELVCWSRKKFGNDHRMTLTLRSDQEWIAELIRKRNAVEHPGGFSGTLELNDVRRPPGRRQQSWRVVTLPREWRRDFQQRGAEDVRRQVRASNFLPDKHRAARHWLWWHDHRLTVIGIIATVIAALAAVASLFV